MKKWTIIALCFVMISFFFGYRHFDSYKEKSLLEVINPQNKEILEIHFVKTPYQNDGLGLFIEDQKIIQELVTLLEGIRIERVNKSALNLGGQEQFSMFGTLSSKSFYILAGKNELTTNLKYYQVVNGTIDMKVFDAFNEKYNNMAP